MKSSYGYVMTFVGCPLYWVSKLQTDISMSTFEAECISLSKAMRYLLPLRKLIQKVGTQFNINFASPATMHSTLFDNNNGALSLDKFPRTTPRTHHISVKYHFFREIFGEGKGIMI